MNVRPKRSIQMKALSNDNCEIDDRPSVQVTLQCLTMSFISSSSVPSSSLTH